MRSRVTRSRRTPSRTASRRSQSTMRRCTSGSGRRRRYGVPQTRARWFMMAARDEDLRLRFPEPTTPGRSVTVQEAFVGLPPGAGSEQYGPGSSPYAELLRNSEFWGLPTGSEGLTHHEAAQAGPRQVARYSLVRPGRRVAGLFTKLDAEAMSSLQGSGVLPKVPFKQSGQRLHPDRPSPTVTATAAAGWSTFGRIGGSLSGRPPACSRSPTASGTAAACTSGTAWSARRCRRCWPGGWGWRFGEF